MFEDALNSITNSLEEKSNIKKTAKRVNALFNELSMLPFEIDVLEDTIENLSDKQKEELVLAIKDRNTEKVSDILGIEKMER